jgi:threonine aldolase
MGKLTEPPCCDNAIHPHHSARVRLRLEQTIPGCEWLLDRWSDLMRRLYSEVAARSIVSEIDTRAATAKNRTGSRCLRSGGLEGKDMQRPPIDLRSDTVTKPTPGMRRAMAEAEVGDDVFGDDPTVKRLEARTAELLGKEEALFVPSGTMANQIGIGVNTQPGDELLCAATSHVYVWEAGGIARLSGVTARTFEGDGGLLSLEDLRHAIRPANDVHYVRTRLICLENTHNRGGGRVHPIGEIAKIARWAREHDLAMHLDGARLMNAVAASGRTARDWCQHFDTVSICFSKGLGAPIGSALAGSSDSIRRARRLRKLFGGGMRQVGIIAAAALYALDHHIDRLREDHAQAQVLAEAFACTDGFTLESGPVETNLVWVAVNPSMGTAAEVAAYLASRGILVSVPGPQVIRACTHLDVTSEQVEYVAQVIREIEPALISAMTLVY